MTAERPQSMDSQGRRGRALALLLLAAVLTAAALAPGAHAAAHRGKHHQRSHRPPPPAASPVPTPLISSAQLAEYASSVARAWEALTDSEGAVLDPLLNAGEAPATNASARFMIIMMADAMLRLSARDSDPSLAATAERILGLTTSLPALSDPFNLLALASLIRDGEQGEFPPETWQRLAGRVEGLVQQITFPVPQQQKCFYQVGCYSNWRLVWAAGASILLQDAVPAGALPGSLLSEPGQVAEDIKADLSLAVKEAGKPTVTSYGTRIRELSDPGEEPLSYHIFSVWMLNTVLANDPEAATPEVERLQQEADNYALGLMAPDGQLSFAGRSLDQSWVQAAAASLGAQLDGSTGDQRWSLFADRALVDLTQNYPIMPDGTLATVPGLAMEWTPALVDRYAEYNQYDGLTLWFLVSALSRWPQVEAEPGSEARLPADRGMLVNDLASSGLVWGRQGSVWWMLSGRSTAPDRRAEQGVVALKVLSDGTWQDVLALRPLKLALTSAWRVGFRAKHVAPVFTSVSGNGHLAVLHGYFPLTKTVHLPATWQLTTVPRGIRLAMRLARRGRPRQQVFKLSAALWTTAFTQPVPGDRWGASYYTCGVSASGSACPVALYWYLSRGQGRHAKATLTIRLHPA